MKTKVFLKTVALSAVILFGSIAASAANKTISFTIRKRKME